MMLIRTIILRLILGMYSASSLDVINLHLSRANNYGMSDYYDNWLTENQPFYFNIESDAELQETIGCSWGGRKNVFPYYKILKLKNGVYVSENIITLKTMKGEWNCKAEYSDKVIQEWIFQVDVDVDECNGGRWPCSSNANCTNTPGSYNCTCFPGYKGNGTYCEAVNVCQSNPCPDDTECRNEISGFSCSAVNPCKHNPCPANEICVEQRPGFKCECRAGLTRNSSSCSALQVMDPCQSNPCQEKARCIRVDQQPGFLCECDQGYESDGPSCKARDAMDPCQSNPCLGDARCISVKQHPGYKCECNQHYERACKDMDECQHNPCHAQAVCVNTYSGFKCYCSQGFTGDGRSLCSDIDECQNTQVCNGIKNSYCKNTEGGFRCECERGYHKDAEGLCEDIDVCIRNTSACKEGDVCWNTLGSNKCDPNVAIRNKSGHDDCPERHIYYLNQGCVYNQCLKITCETGAECKMLNAKVICYCKNGATVKPYEECSILAEAGPPPNTHVHVRNSNSVEPSIDILLYISKTDKSLKHYTTGYDGLILDEKFTITVTTKHEDLSNNEKRIICYKKEDLMVIHLNQTLKYSADSKYKTEVSKAHHGMNGKWLCLIKTSSYADKLRPRSSTRLATTVVEFPVTIVNAPVTKLPIQSAYDPADNIYIEFDNGNATERNTTLWLNRPFSIVIKSTSNEVTNISSIKCHFARNPFEIFTNNETLVWDRPKQVYTAQEGKAEAKMNSIWHCDITYYKSPSKIYHCHLNFSVTVKNPVFEKHGEVYVNDVLVKTTPVKAKGTYEFFVGEIVKVSCKKYGALLMNMTYFDGKSSDIVPITSSIQEQTMYVKIVRANAYIHCNVIITTNMHDVQSLRLDFILRRHPSALPTFNVNGLTLAPRQASGGNNYTLFYEYFEGEFINFTVSNGQGWKKDDGTNKTKLQGGKFTYSKYAYKKTIKFASEDGKTEIIFNLIPVPYYFNAIVSGLPFSQTNIKYLNNSLTYRTVFFNKNNTILNLNCSSPKMQYCTWDQNFTMPNDSLITSITNITYSPQEHKSKDVLKCTCGKYTHEVTILSDIRKNKYDGARGKEDKRDSDKRYEETEIGPGIGSSDNSKNSNGGNNTLILVVIIVVALVVVAAVVWLMVGLYKRRQRREKAIQSEFNYESLENTTERSMPTPAQWDNYSLPVDRQIENNTETYSVPYVERNVEEMYAKPQPKTMRKPPNQSLYTEPSYATVDQIGENPTYGNLSNKTAEYSQIKPKKLIGSANTTKVLPTEAPYAEVLPKSMRSNKESSKYVNVFDNQRYVNSGNGESSRDRSEYAEPAYCEIGIKK